MRTIIIIFSIFFLISATPVHAETGSYQVNTMDNNGFIYIAADSLNEVLSTVPVWSNIDGEYLAKTGRTELRFQTGVASFYINGVKKALAAPPLEVKSILWLPEDFFNEIGLELANRAEKAADLNWKENYLLTIKAGVYHSLPGISLSATNSISLKRVNSNPDRLIFDLPGIKTHPFTETSFNNQVVKDYDLKQNQTGLRITLKLTHAIPYQIIQTAETPESALILFNNLLQEFNLTTIGTDSKLSIKTLVPAEYQVLSKPNEQQLIIEFMNTTIISKKSLPRDSSWLRSITLTELGPDKIRLVIDFYKPNRYYVTVSADDPNSIEIRPLLLIKEIRWSKADKGELIEITGTGELIRKEPTYGPDWWEMEFDLAQFAPDLKLPDTQGDQVQEIKLITLNGDTVKIQIQLSNTITYQTKITYDREQAALFFGSSPLLGKTILLDAGHGGEDTGARSKNGILEKDVNLEVVLRLKTWLDASGAVTVLTRSDDSFISLYERAFTANELMVDLFLSVHTNFHPNPKVRGLEVFHYQERAMANPIAASILRQMAIQTGFQELGVKTSNFVVIRETQMPGILVELGFLSNPEETAVIATSKFREQAALGIFRGVVEVQR